MCEEYIIYCERHREKGTKGYFDAFVCSLLTLFCRWRFSIRFAREMVQIRLCNSSTDGLVLIRLFNSSTDGLVRLAYSPIDGSHCKWVLNLRNAVTTSHQSNC